MPNPIFNKADINAIFTLPEPQTRFTATSIPSIFPFSLSLINQVNSEMVFFSSSKINSNLLDKLTGKFLDAIKNILFHSSPSTAYFT